MEFCFNCGHLGHTKTSCVVLTSHNQITNSNVYGALLRAEANAYKVVREGDYLRQVEIPRGELFDSFSSDGNSDHTSEVEVKDDGQSSKKEDGSYETHQKIGESTQERVNPNVPFTPYPAPENSEKSNPQHVNLLPAQKFGENRQLRTI